jgi:hypothetical protein
MGWWGLALPQNFGSLIFNDTATQVSASYQFNDMVSATALYARLFDLQGSDAVFPRNEEIDAFALILPMAFDGANFTPYVVYAAHGDNATAPGIPTYQGLTSLNATVMDDDATVWWAGAAFNMSMFDPFVFYLDFIWGSQSGSQDQNDRSGWWFDVAMDYTGFDMVTPRLFFGWGSGEDEDLTDGSERMPTLGGAAAEGCGCGLTSFGTDGSSLTFGQDQALTGNGYGFWVLGGSLVNFSFVESVSHTLTLAYGQGTNDKESVEDYPGNAAGNGNAAGAASFLANGLGGVGNYAGYVTEEDSFWEFNFDTKYQMYENLAAYLEIGYISVNLDEDVWGGIDEEAASKLGIGFDYAF